MSDEYNDSYAEPKPDAVQVDFHGIKTRLNPKPPERAPTDIKEVWQRVWKSLLGISVHVVEFVEDTLISARSYVRGIGEPRDPGVVQQIAESHAQAKNQEGAAQRQLESSDQRKLVTEEGAIAKLQGVFDKIRARGAVAVLVQLPDGTFVVLAVKPDLEAIAIAAAQASIEDSGGNPIKISSKGVAIALEAMSGAITGSAGAAHASSGKVVSEPGEKPKPPLT